MRPSLCHQEPAGCAEERGAPAAPLGNTADLVSTRPEVVEDQQPEILQNAGNSAVILPPSSTVRGYWLRWHARDLLKRQGIWRRMRFCGSRVATRRGQAATVDLFQRPGQAYGRVSGVCVCGQSICCPVCAPRIAAFRAEEISKGYERAVDAGNEVRLETFTMPHELDYSPAALERSLDDLAVMWRSHQNHASRRERGAVGHHLATEVTWGNHGWHPHRHRLRYDKPGTFEPDLAKAQWLAALECRDRRTDAAEIYAYDCAPVDSVAAATYCSKLATTADAQFRAVGSELASASTKGSNMNTLLAAHVCGDLMAGAIWTNGAATITARKISSVRWSRMLRWKLGLDVEERTDDEIAQDKAEPSDRWLGELNATQWRGIIANKCELALLAHAQQGEASVNEFLAGLSLGALNDEDPYLAWKNQRLGETKEIQSC